MSQQVEQDKPQHQSEDQDQSKSQQPEGKQPAKENKSAAEWITFAMSLAIIVALVAGVSFLSFTNASRPATFEVKFLKDEIRQAGEAYYLPIEINNTGSKTAEEVMVQVTLTSGDDKTEPEESEVTIMILAGGSTADAVVVFKQDPTKGQLEADVISYIKP